MHQEEEIPGGSYLIAVGLFQEKVRLSAHYHYPHCHRYPRIQARVTVGTEDVSTDDMTVAIDEDLEVVEEFSVDEVREVKKEFILTDFIIVCF